MTTILSYFLFCISFCCFVAAVYFGVEADQWLLISGLIFTVCGLVLDMVTYKDKI